MKVRKASRGIGAVMLCAIFAAALMEAPAEAYPPGQAATLSITNAGVSTTMVNVNTTVGVQAFHVISGITSIKFGSTVKRTVASNSNSTPVIYFKPTSAGTYVVWAQAENKEKTANYSLYVPSATLPKSGRVGAVLSAVIRYAKQGSLASLTVGPETYGPCVVNSSNTCKIAFTLENVGVQNVTVTVGSLVLPVIKITGL